MGLRSHNILYKYMDQSHNMLWSSGQRLTLLTRCHGRPHWNVTVLAPFALGEMSDTPGCEPLFMQ